MTSRPAEPKLHYGRTCCIGLAFMGISAFWQLYDSIIPLMLKNSFLMGDTVTGAIMALDNVLAVVLLPILGAWSDRVDTRFGKRMPFIVVGTLLSVLFMLVIPAADTTGNLVLFVVGLAAVLLSMGFYRAPAVALMPDLTPPQLRSQGNAVINVMGALGAIFALVLIQFLVADSGKPDYMPLFACVAGIMLIALFLLLVTIREKKVAAEVEAEYPGYETAGNEENRGQLSPAVKISLIFALLATFFYYMSYNGVTTAFSRYAQEVWGLTGGDFAIALIIVAGSAFVSYVPLGILASKIGRKKVIAAGFTMMAIMFVVATFITEYHAWTGLLFVVVGVAGSAVGVNLFPMVVDMCDNSELGKYTGMYYTFSMSAQIATPILSGALLEHVSYMTLFPYAAVFSVLGVLCALRVRHGDAALHGPRDAETGDAESCGAEAPCDDDEYREALA